MSQLNLNDGQFRENIDGVEHGKTSQVTGMNRILNFIQGNCNFLKGLVDKKANSSTKINAGKGLAGGGDLSTDRTIDVGASDDSITVEANGIKVNTYDNVNSTSTTRPASAGAVKKAYDKANTAQETAENKLDKGTYQGDAQDLKDEIDEKQNKNDESLKTKFKSIVGAINEVYDDKLTGRSYAGDDLDLNTLKVDGLYYGYKWVNAPINTIACVDVKKYSEDWIVQIFYVINSADDLRIFIRNFYTGSIWTEWVDILTERSKALMAIVGGDTYKLIQSSGQKSVNYIYYDKVTKKPYVAIKNTSATSVTDDFMPLTTYDLRQTAIGGVSQRWVNVKSSRAKNVTYTNTSRAPIMASIGVTTDGSAEFYIDDIQVGYMFKSTNDMTFSFIIPAGSTYRFSGSADLLVWAELR